MIIKVSSKFKKSYRRLPEKIKEKAKKKESIFRNNPFDIRLKTHKLSGVDKTCWAFWVDNSYRVKFIFFSKGEVLFLDVGAHDIYK